MPDLTDVFEYIAVFGFFFLFLRSLISLAKTDLKRPRKLTKASDEFYKLNGYTYDYVMVFKIYDEDFKKRMNSYQRKFSMKSVVDRIQFAGMESRCFYSCQRDEVYVKVRCSPQRLKGEADRIKYKLLLDKERLRIRVQAGSKAGTWKGFSIIDEKRVSTFDPYEHIYGQYSIVPELQPLYQTYLIGDQKHIFRGVDRIKLILSILEAKASDTPPGCDITIKDLAHHECVMAAFPIHEFDELKKLTLKWLTLFSPPWKQPIDLVKDYYGERIGIYFLYLQHYVTLLMLPAFLGAITYIVRVYYVRSENFLMPYFAVFMTLWSTFFIEFWKRTQSTIAMKWGVEGYESNEQDRPQFEGENILSPINGQSMLYFAKSDKDYRVRIANSITMVAVLIVIMVVSGVFYLQLFMSSPAQIELFTVRGFNLANIITSLLSAVAIGILNLVYGSVSIQLNDYENHRTDTEYEDNLISKIFIFQLVNSFAALTYVSFIKYFLNIPCVRDDCIGDSASSLSTIFIVRLVTSAVVNVFVQKYMQHRKQIAESEGLEPGVVMSPIEEQYVLNEYGVLLGTLTDYAGLVIQYGYTVLFVAAFPLAPTLAFVSSYIQIRIDGWRLCQAHRRPQPKTAEDMGVWQEMLEIITILSVIYNFGLLFFTSHYLVNISWEYRWIMFIVAEHFMFAIKYTLSFSIEDSPADVLIQLERQKFLVSKVIENQPDEVDEEYVQSGKKTNIMIANTDFDWEDPEDDDYDFDNDFPGNTDVIPEGEEQKMPI